MGIFDSDSSSDTTHFSSDLSSGPPAGDTGLFDRDLEDFLIREREKANINSQIIEYNDLCWDKCIQDGPSSKLSGSAETCLSNCVERFIDTSVFIVNRFAIAMQRVSM